MLKKLHFKSLLLIAVMLLGGASAWGAKYSSVLVFDCADASQNGSQSLYGVANTVTMGNTALQAFLNKAAGVTNKITVASGAVTGSVYWAKGQGGTGIPSDCLKVGKASSAGAFTFSIDDSFSKVDRVVITGYGWKNTSAISVNSSESQTPTSAATETTFTFDLESSTRTISVSVTTSAVCITSIELFAATTGPEITASDVDLAYNATSGVIPYTITNPSGATLSATTTDDWISIVAVDGEKVTFNATENSSFVEREGTITLSYEGAADKEVTVTQAAHPVAVTGITLPSKANVEKGGTITLKPTIVPANATNQNVTWESDDPDVAFVSDGVVTGKTTGTARITATTEDGHKTAYCDVTVITAATPDEEFEFSTMGYENAADITNVAGTNVNLLFAKASGQNAPKYYDTGTGARMYADNTLTITSTKVIKKIVFTFDDTYVGALSADEGEYADGVWTGAESNIVFTNDSKSQARIQKIAVFFKNEEILVSAAGFATFCSPFALDFTGLTIEAYTAEIKVSNVEFTKVEGSVPANTGLLVKAAAEGIYEVPAVASSTTNVSGNVLVGVIDATVIDGTSANYYVLKQNTEGVGFYKVASANYTVRANSAYLADGAGAKGFIPVDGTTAIELVDTANEVAAPAYNLQGQRVSEGYKGVVIVNGKKIMMK